MVLFSKLIRTEHKWTHSLTLNGTIVGIVAQCAGCDRYYIWSALLIGCLSSLVYMGISKLMLMLKFDDPLDAVAIHAGGGKKVYSAFLNQYIKLIILYIVI